MARLSCLGEVEETVVESERESCQASDRSSNIFYFFSSQNMIFFYP